VIRVTADSNIYLSALLFGGPPDDLLTLARDGRIHLTVSDDILNEVTRVLSDKFKWPPRAVALARNHIGGFTEKVAPTERIDVVKDDPTDDRILECAQAGKSEYLITRDKHLLKLKTFGPTKIVLVADFLQAFRKQGQFR
jgi:putative PIN family toxin of toxin-antitoxin system